MKNYHLLHCSIQKITITQIKTYDSRHNKEFPDGTPRAKWGEMGLTGGGDEGVDDDPVDEEQHEDHERPERLDQEQRQVDETLARLVEQRHDEDEARTHHHDHQQQYHLATAAELMQ